MREISDERNIIILHIKAFSCFKTSDDAFILLINVKMQTIVGIFTFMSRINFMFRSVEHEKSFIAPSTVVLCEPD